MALVIPRWGAIGLFLNPGPFNQKEHAAAVIMASAAAVSALSTEALAAQKLWYGGYPSQAAGVFLTLSSQLIGYGIAGMMRSSLLWPTKMLYPANLPVTTVLETLHKERASNKKRMKVFWIIFFVLLVWELLPEVCFINGLGSFGVFLMLCSISSHFSLAFRSSVLQINTTLFSPIFSVVPMETRVLGSCPFPSTGIMSLVSALRYGYHFKLWLTALLVLSAV